MTDSIHKNSIEFVMGQILTKISNIETRIVVIEKEVRGLGTWKAQMIGIQTGITLIISSAITSFTFWKINR